MYYTYNDQTSLYELRNSVGSTCKRHPSVGVLYSWDTGKMVNYGDPEEMSKLQLELAEKGKVKIILTYSKDWDLAVLNRIVSEEQNCDILIDGRGFCGSYRESYYGNVPNTPVSTIEEKPIKAMRPGRVDPWSL